MKSSFELAMERLGGIKELPPEKKKLIAEIESKCKAKIAEAEISAEKDSKALELQMKSNRSKRNSPRISPESGIGPGAKRKKSERKTDNSLRRISLSKQKYLETIYMLQGCDIEGAHAHVKDIAEELGIKMASVSGAARILEKENLIRYHARRQISLTPDGLKMALSLNDKHRTLSQFFCKVLGCDESKSERFACEIEHVIDDDIRARLEKLMSSFFPECARKRD